MNLSTSAQNKKKLKFELFQNSNFFKFQMKDQYRQSQNIVKSVCKDGDVTKEWSSNYYPEQGLMESMYGGKVTLPECFNRVCELYPERKALGTRELLSEVDEKQPNGRVFKKVRGVHRCW